MTISADADAALLIGGYQTESRHLLATFIARDKSFTFCLDATVSDFVEGSRLGLKASDGGYCDVDLRGCQFRYGDMREAPEAFREPLAEVAGILGIVFPSGECLWIAEMSPDS